MTSTSAGTATAAAAGAATTAAGVGISTTEQGGLRVLRPDLDDESKRLFIALSDAIQYQFLPTYDPIHRPMEGIRDIQKGRLEMFVHNCHDKSCRAFETLCQMMLSSKNKDDNGNLLPDCYDSVETIRDAIISYAQMATLLDDRIVGTAASASTTKTDQNEDDGSSTGSDSGTSNTVHYGPMSLIITQGNVPDQLPHVDVQPPDYQFGLILTDDSPGTRVYQSNRPIVRTPDDLVQFLLRRMDHHDHDVNDENDHSTTTRSSSSSSSSSKIATTISRFPELVELLAKFGICLSTFHPDDYTVVSSLDHLSTGTVLSLPGGMLHAGPGCTEFRTVLFWTAHSTRRGIYHPDLQYFDGLLLGELMLPIWRFVTEHDRYVLLHNLYPAAKRYPALWGHFHDRQLQNFLHRLTVSKCPEALIRNFVKSASFPPIPIGYPIAGEILTCVSAQHLATLPIDDDEEEEKKTQPLPIVVYRRPNNGVCIQYQNSLEWEGANVDENPYQLILNKGCRYFNGANGTLRDSDGDIVHCFIAKENLHVVHELPTNLFIEQQTTTTIAQNGDDDDKYIDYNNDDNAVIIDDDDGTAARTTATDTVVVDGVVDDVVATLTLPAAKWPKTRKRGRDCST